MQNSVVFFFRGIRVLSGYLLPPIDWIINYVLFYINGVQFSSFKDIGWPKIHVGIGGTCSIGPGFRSKNREMSNPNDRFHKCCIIVGKKGELVIGKNVGISSTTIVWHDSIIIGDNANLGGNVVINDADFHILNPIDSRDKLKDKENTKIKPVIGDDSFIDAHIIILNGVYLVENFVVGSCSLVSKNIHNNEIWARNPARMIRTLK